MQETKKTFPLSKVYQLIEPGPIVLVTTSCEGKPNVMTMSWHMMIDFVPPLIASVISDQSCTFACLQKTKECVINIPSVELTRKVIGVGNVSGRNVDKFKKFHLGTEPALSVKAPLLSECYASLECRVVDTRMSKKYNIFIFEVIKAWIRPMKKPRMIHHSGQGNIIVDGELLKIPSKMK